MFAGLTRSRETPPETSAPDREWIIARPTFLTDGPARGRFKVTTDLTPVPGWISRGDVAAFMVALLASDQYLRKAPLIGG